jgi:protein phosphatase
MKSALVSEPRAGRERNEDAAVMNVKRGLFIVADGMGGDAAGEFASAAAVETAMRSLRAWSDGGRGDPKAALVMAAVSADLRIRELSARIPGTEGMGSTIVAAILEGNRLFVMNVGDSRAYLLRDASLIRLSEDHSLVATMTKSGTITGEEAKTHVLRHILTRALGTGGPPEPAFREIAVRQGDFILLCSDGVTEALDDEAIAKAGLDAQGDPERFCLALVNAGRLIDDATALVFGIEG